MKDPALFAAAFLIAADCMENMDRGGGGGLEEKGEK